MDLKFKFLALSKQKFLKALPNIDIDKILKHIKYFRGVFARNILPKKINDLEIGVVNNDTIQGKYIGTHWVCYYNNPKNKYIEFFDSFGLETK